MRVREGGELYGFCPGKATWDANAAHLFRLLCLTALTGVFYSSGGLKDQPNWYVELAAWFVPCYDNMKFYNRAEAILGDNSKGKGLPNGNK